jgi:hypothetical protein
LGAAQFSGATLGHDVLTCGCRGLHPRLSSSRSALHEVRTQGLMARANRDGTNAAMAAVAVAQDLDRR